MLQKELELTPSAKTDAAAAFLASLEETKLTSLGEAGKKPPIEILPPGMASLSAPPVTIKKPPTTSTQTPTPTSAQSTAPAAAQSSTATEGSSQPEPEKPLMLEAPPPAEPTESNPPVSETASGPVASP
uniref:Classical arabinogalactan protein 9 n=1 Tax=Elaeis guineensis var. tenera TaxID=51953 RepID=A0A6J0PJM3_ELAGV|nr:classical arabinogalactan protein 9 [Elaeis guineensis]